MRNAKLRTLLILAFTSRIVLALTLTPFLHSDISAQQNPAVFAGSWTASAGGDRYLRGTWSAQVTGPNHNAAEGSWTLLSDAGEVVMQGTWSARKSTQSWQGTWTARVARGGALSGSWTADLKEFNGKTFEEMLQRTMEKQVAGGWRSGANQGYWWLEGTRQKPKGK